MFLGETVQILELANKIALTKNIAKLEKVINGGFASSIDFKGIFSTGVD